MHTRHSFTSRHTLGHLITSEQYVNNPDITTSILELLMVVVKELVEALPSISPNDMNTINEARECFSVVFNCIPAVLHQEYLNPVLVLPDILSVGSRSGYHV